MCLNVHTLLMNVSVLFCYGRGDKICSRVVGLPLRPCYPFPSFLSPTRTTTYLLTLTLGRKSTGRAQTLSKDDRLSIELKEKRSLPRKRIAEYFPRKFVGSLQVRYYTRLEGRKAGDSGQSGRNFNVTRGSSYRGTSCEAVRAGGSPRITEGVARQQYGPPRRRQIVDRYSPV